MSRFTIAALALAASLPSAVLAAPAYDADGRLRFPNDYRTWIYLSTGLGMSYNAVAMGGEVFDNVFVDPVSYKAFLETGTWPDGTELVLEVREAQQKGSINKSGHFQGAAVHREVHLKDSTRFKGGWAFFPFSDETPAKMIATTADCYSCHQAHGAVDTTFVQFYPTLLPIAQEKKTLSASYLADEAK
jgi:hypothetical protein